MKRIFVLLLASLLAACASSVGSKIQPAKQNLAKFDKLEDTNVVTALEKNLDAAKSADMPFLAPHYYQDASQLLNESRKLAGANQHTQLVATAAKADAILEHGRAIMDVVEERLAPELDLINQLDLRDTAKLLPKDYETALAGVSGLIDKLEHDQAADIEKDRGAVQNNLRDLLASVIPLSALRPAETINADSKKKGAEQQAPATYAEALKVYQDAKSQIAADYQNEKVVRKASAQALFAARHAQQINNQVAALQTRLNPPPAGGAKAKKSGGQATDPAVLEQLALEQEDRLSVIAATLDLEDLRDRPLDKQVETIKRAIIAAGKQSRSRGDQAADLKAKLKSAEETAQQNAEQLAGKDKQIDEQTEQIKSLNDKLEQLSKKPADKAKTKTKKP